MIIMAVDGDFGASMPEYNGLKIATNYQLKYSKIIIKKFKKIKKASTESYRQV